MKLLNKYSKEYRGQEKLENNQDTPIKSRQALKRCLGVKASTHDDILYTELDRPNIVSSTKDSTNLWRMD